MMQRWKSLAPTTAGVVIAIAIAVALAAGAVTAAEKTGDDKSALGHHTRAAAELTDKTSPSRQSVKSGRALADELSLAFESAAEAVAPSVVAVLSEKMLASPRQGHPGLPDLPFGDLFRFFGQPGQRQPNPWDQEPQRGLARGAGSGVIVRADGYILTNNHVVEGATKVTVVLADDRELEAQVIGTDPETDLAVIKVDADNLPAAQLGDSSAARVGQWVIAVGNPFDLRHSVTAGIISATGRSTVGLATYEDFLQTDASINPGNSGGALADLDGRVIGINTAISSPSGGNVGIGFAIPIDMAERVMADLIDDGSIERGFLALVPQDLDPTLAKAFGLDSTAGALVAEVTPDGPADKAGIQAGDVIVAVDRKPIADSMDLRNRVAAVKPGAKAEIELLRDGRNKNLEVKLGTRPGVRTANNGTAPGNAPDQLTNYGFEARDLTPELANQAGYSGLTGALVVRIDPAGTAASAGLRRGDLIQRVGRSSVDNVADLERLLSESAGKEMALQVRRGQGSLYLALPADEGRGPASN